MIKKYYKQWKDLNQVNNYLTKIGLKDFALDSLVEEYDFDSWVDSSEVMGVSVQVDMNFEVFVSKYTLRDLRKLEKELGI